MATECESTWFGVTFDSSLHWLFLYLCMLSPWYCNHGRLWTDVKKSLVLFHNTLFVFNVPLLLSLCCLHVKMVDLFSFLCKMLPYTIQHRVNRLVWSSQHYLWVLRSCVNFMFSFVPQSQSSQGGGHRTLLYGHAILLRHYHSSMVSYTCQLFFTIYDV